MMNPTTDIDSDSTETINATLTKFSSDISLTYPPLKIYFVSF